MPEAQHFSIVIVDVEGSGALRDMAKPEMRQDLYDLVRDCLHARGVDYAACHTEDRGDGVYLLVPGDVPKRLLGTAFVADLDRKLAERRVGDTRLRIRLALHCGEVIRDKQGSSGTDVDHAFAMVDNQSVRDVLAAAPQSRLVVVISDAIFRAAFCSHPDDDPTWLRRQYLCTKREVLPVWVGVPGLRHPPVVDTPEVEQATAEQPPAAHPGQTYIAPVIGGDSNAPIAGGDSIASVGGRNVTIGRDYAPRIGAPGKARGHER